MLSKSESGDNQKSTQTVLEGSKEKRNAPGDDLLKKSINTGKSA